VKPRRSDGQSKNGPDVYPDQDWLVRSNEETLYHLERQGRSGPGLVPFLGAGVSTAFGLKDWRTLLSTAAPPHLSRRVEALLDENDYEGAAETLLKELQPDGFQNMVAQSAGDGNLKTFDFCQGMVAILPLLASGPVVTTNFDRILEYAFEANQAPFESVVSGPRPDLIVDALHGNRRVLIKLHGDWQDRVGRTFAESDYAANYGQSQPERKRELLASAARLIFSSRSVLFIGASLSLDRTVEVLKQVHADYAGIRHFSITSLPPKARDFHRKERHFRDLGVLPLWYVARTAKDHIQQVERLVKSIVERVSVGMVSMPTAGRRRRVTRMKWTRPSQAAPAALHATLERVVRLVEDGRLTFFLGSAVHWPTKLMAREFYDELARIFECEALKEERFAVAQYIADRYGRENLYSEIRKLFARSRLPPRDTHALFSHWDDFRTQAGGRVPYPTIFTTNYDDVLERVLWDSGLPYHLFSYQTDGPQQGLFYHRNTDGSLRLIERPRNIREVAPGFVVVKMNGGLDRERRIPESYATTRLDYWDLAARIPGVLPEFLRCALGDHPLLFLGHGLAAADIEAIVRYAHKRHPGPRSWAVVLNHHGVEYWRQCGVEIINWEVNLYVRELHKRLLKNGP
jgi:hypothetical protein